MPTEAKSEEKSEAKVEGPARDGELLKLLGYWGSRDVRGRLREFFVGHAHVFGDADGAVEGRAETPFLVRPEPRRALAR